MDFSLTTLFVVPVGNVLPTTGSTENLTAGQVGFFDENYDVTDGTGTPEYIYVAQGRTERYLMASKRSDKIAASKVKVWQKVTGSGTAAVQITEVSDFTAKCGEDVNITVRLHSSYIDTIAFNGLTRTVTVKGACCECGGDPCADADAEAIVDAILEKVAQEAALNYDPSALHLNTFLTWEKVGTGASTILRITGKPLTKYGNECDVAAFPYEYDRMWFRVFAYKGPDTSADFIVSDKCDAVATVTITQRSSFPWGTSDEVKQLEKDYFSYQSAPHKHLFRMAGYNQAFESYVTDGEVYDFYLIQFDQYESDLDYNPGVHMDERVIIEAPQGAESDAIEAVLTAFLGAPKDTTSPIVTTTTDTTTSSTSTSSTTIMIP